MAGPGLPGLGHQSIGRARATAPERTTQRGLPRGAAIAADACDGPKRAPPGNPAVSSSSLRPLGGLGLTLDLVPGDPRATPQPVPYQLPFRGVPVQVAQGFGGHFSHADAPNWYAVDFAMPQGTPVLAARDGVVMQVQHDVLDNSPNDPAAGGGNLVRVLHADGSMALYAHLAPDGVAVRPGQAVRTGERLGSSGNTGFSTAPHLHFAIQRNADMQLVSLPFRMLGPQGELQFPSPAP